MKAQLYWVEGPTGHRVAILARPRGGDWLEDEVRSWRDQGVDVVVSLLTDSEIGELGLAEEAAACATVGLEFMAVPVLDRGVPSSRESFGKVVARLSDLLAAGRKVGIHCRAGIGRSAMLAASLLIASGLSLDDAFERVRVARGSPVPDTPEQRAWVEEFAGTYPVKAV